MHLDQSGCFAVRQWHLHVQVSRQADECCADWCAKALVGNTFVCMCHSTMPSNELTACTQSPSFTRHVCILNTTGGSAIAVFDSDLQPPVTTQQTLVTEAPLEAALNRLLA